MINHRPVAGGARWRGLPSVRNIPRSPIVESGCAPLPVRAPQSLHGRTCARRATSRKLLGLLQLEVVVLEIRLWVHAVVEPELALPAIELGKTKRTEGWNFPRAFALG